MPNADKALTHLEQGGAGTAVRLRQVRKALARLTVDPRHPALHSHQYESFPGYTKGTKVWDSYVNQDDGAWRIYWTYGPDETGSQGEPVKVITVLEIRKHR
ncbi:hypothetical protein [Streptomyces sp. NPDC096033]|uniref:hypothetical protein n=1 Tax=Streptomyces sp. NPDC096033 TaxID=3366071 RepID=UPI00381775DC